MKNMLRVVRDGRGIKYHLALCTDDELLCIAQNAEAQIASTRKFLDSVLFEIRVREGMRPCG